MTGQMGCRELVDWFAFATAAMGVLCGLAATAAAVAGFVDWGTPFEAVGIGAVFGLVFALARLLAQGRRRELDRLPPLYGAPIGAEGPTPAIVGVFLLAIPIVIVTVGAAHYDQAGKPGGCRGFDVDLQGNHVRAPNVPCAEVPIGDGIKPMTVALLGVARETGGTTGDWLHVCVGITTPERGPGGEILSLMQPPLRLAHQGITLAPVAEIASGREGFRCGLRRHVSWPGAVSDELFLVPVGERDHQLVVGGSPDALDLGNL